MSEIKEAILKTISDHIDEQGAKGLPKYGVSLDNAPMDAHDWQQMIIEEAIDALKYQQKYIGKLQRDLKTAEEFGEMYRLKYMKVVEGE